MSSNTRIMSVGPDVVWQVLTDGWLYPLFVVGASRMREVDAAWPTPGARLHHSVGVWPLLLDDVTEVLASEPQHRLVLRAHGWPAGAARVTITLEAHDDGAKVTIEEDAESGPARVVPKPLMDVQLAWRNVETLRRLAYIAERRP